MATASPSTAKPRVWTKRHIIEASALSHADIETIVAEARMFSELLSQPVKKSPVLLGKAVVNMFYEDSTRTRTSFELAGKYLSADVVNFGVSSSSVKKGETLIDTAETLAAMGIDSIVIRHSSSGVCKQLANHFGDRLSIINAGDGCHEHPSQGLLDLYSLLEKMPSVANKKIVIAGDITHSRVARSNLHILNTMGADVHVVGPATLIPEGISKLGCKVHTNLENAIADADVVMCLRLQLERQTSGLIPSIGEYKSLYGITKERLMRFAKPGVIVMHPGPMNRGVEITSDVADDPNFSIITNQVRNGVAVRMALLHLTIAGQTFDGAFSQ